MLQIKLVHCDCIECIERIFTVKFSLNSYVTYTSRHLVALRAPNFHCEQNEEKNGKVKERDDAYREKNI